MLAGRSLLAVHGHEPLRSAPPGRRSALALPLLGELAAFFLVPSPFGEGGKDSKRDRRETVEDKLHALFFGFVHAWRIKGWRALCQAQVNTVLIAEVTSPTMIAATMSGRVHGGGPISPHTRGSFGGCHGLGVVSGRQTVLILSVTRILSMIYSPLLPSSVIAVSR